MPQYPTSRVRKKSTKFHSSIIRQVMNDLGPWLTGLKRHPRGSTFSLFLTDNYTSAFFRTLLGLCRFTPQFQVIPYLHQVPAFSQFDRHNILDSVGLLSPL